MPTRQRTIGTILLSYVKNRLTITNIWSNSQSTPVTTFIYAIGSAHSSLTTHLLFVHFFGTMFHYKKKAIPFPIRDGIISCIFPFSSRCYDQNLPNFVGKTSLVFGWNYLNFGWTQYCQSYHSSNNGCKMQITPCKKITKKLKLKTPCFLSFFLSWPWLRLGPPHSLVIEWKLKSLPTLNYEVGGCGAQKVECPIFYDTHGYS